MIFLFFFHIVNLSNILGSVPRVKAKEGIMWPLDNEEGTSLKTYDLLCILDKASQVRVFSIIVPSTSLGI